MEVAVADLLHSLRYGGEYGSRPEALLVQWRAGIAIGTHGSLASSDECVGRMVGVSDGCAERTLHGGAQDFFSRITCLCCPLQVWETTTMDPIG